LTVNRLKKASGEASFGQAGPGRAQPAREASALVRGDCGGSAPATRRQPRAQAGAV